MEGPLGEHRVGQEAEELGEHGRAFIVVSSGKERQGKQT